MRVIIAAFPKVQIQPETLKITPKVASIKTLDVQVKYLWCTNSKIEFVVNFSI